MKESITVELDEPIMYSAKDGEVEGSFVVLKPPTGKQSHICCELEALIQSSITQSAANLPQEMIDQAKDNKQDDDEKIDGQTLMTIINGGGADMKKFTLLFIDLFKQVGEIGGEKTLTAPIIDRLDHRDIRKMMGEYAVNFVYL